MKKVIAIVALGISLAACETYDPYYYDGYYDGYGPRGYYYGRSYRHRPHYKRDRECYEVRDEYNSRFLECRNVRRMKAERRWKDED